MKRLEGSIDIEKIKRCYVEGVVIFAKCPNCGSEMHHDFSGDYLSHPVVGEESTCYFVCCTCEDNDADNFEFEIPMKVISAKVIIEYDDTKISVA